MKRFILISCLVAAVAWAQAQTCLVPAPVAPPIPREAIITLPADGGTQGCTLVATVTNSPRPANSYAIGNAKCAIAVAMAQQAAANDNGWNDGGAP